jgi:hypothetical protein
MRLFAIDKEEELIYEQIALSSYQTNPCYSFYSLRPDVHMSGIINNFSFYSNIIYNLALKPFL